MTLYCLGLSSSDAVVTSPNPTIRHSLELELPYPVGCSFGFPTAKQTLRSALPTPMNISSPSPTALSNPLHPLPHSFSPTTTNIHPYIRKINWVRLPPVQFSPNRVFAIKSSMGGEYDATVVNSPAKSLRRLLSSPGIHLGPACFDALSAKLVERAGFDFCFTTGFGISAARLGLPDAGLISYGEMVDQGRQITGAVSIPVIGDGDNGYGNAMNVKRTVKGYIGAGLAGIILEDQVSPKACGHTQGRKVVSREEAVMKIKAAVDARKESGADIVIVARTDSRQAVSLEESLWRTRALADAGADVVFIDALTSKAEMKAFCEVSPAVPKLANMLEGGGRTPIMSPIELAEVGYKIVAYPLSLVGVSIRAMQDALLAIKGGRVPSPGSMPSFDELKEILGFNLYYDEEKRYSTKNNQPQAEKQYGTENDQIIANPGVEVVIPEIYTDGPGNPFSGIWSRKLRVKITGLDGYERLDVRIPAGFLEGVVNIVPALGGMNLKELLNDAALEDGGHQLLDFNDAKGDRIQVFLE